MESQFIHHHIPKMQVLHPCDWHALISYRWTANGHPGKKSRRWIMHRLPVTKYEGSPGKKTPQSSLLSLFVNLFPQYVQTCACLDVISGLMKEEMVTGNHQDGFTEVKSCLTNMIAFCHKMTGFVDERSLVLNRLSHSIFEPNLI